MRTGIPLTRFCWCTGLDFDISIGSELGPGTEGVRFAVARLTLDHEIPYILHFPNLKIFDLRLVLQGGPKVLLMNGDFPIVVNMSDDTPRGT
jgi:hypothetical protein